VGKQCALSTYSLFSNKCQIYAHLLKYVNWEVQEEKETSQERPLDITQLKSIGYLKDESLLRHGSKTSAFAAKSRHRPPPIGGGLGGPQVVFIPIFDAKTARPPPNSPKGGLALPERGGLCLTVRRFEANAFDHQDAKPEAGHSCRPKRTRMSVLQEFTI
jgi:hypothetical protein